MNYKKNNHLFLSCSSFCLILAGCANQGLPSQLTSIFHTRITQSGLKHFEVRIVPIAYKEAIENGAVIAQGEETTYFANGERKRVNSDRVAKKNEKRLHHEIEELIKDNNYCRSGYWVLDSNYYGSAPFVRGECNDLATASDRELFPDNIKFW